MTTTTQKSSFNSSKLWTGLLTILALVGVVCWVLQLTVGLQLTHLNNINMWGLYIVGFMIFTGVAAGSLFFTSVPYIFHLDQYKPYTRISAYTGAVSSIVAAGLFIIVDIGHPDRVWELILRSHLTSPMFWDFLMLSAYMVLSIIFTRQLILVHNGKKDEKSLKPIAVISLIAGILVIVTSFVFAMQIARPMWNTPVEPVSFLIVALIAALAVLSLIYLVLDRSGYLKMPAELLTPISKLMAGLLVVESIIVLVEVLTGLYPGGGEHYEKMHWLVMGRGAVGFWIEVAALIGALILLGRNEIGRKTGMFAGGITLTLIAVYLIKSNLLQAELFNPLINYPWANMTTTMGPYIPSWLEIGLSTGIVALGILLLRLGFKVLDLGSNPPQINKKTVVPNNMQTGK